jgi:hypothetical protein
MNMSSSNQVERGSAVVMRGSNVIGIVGTADRSQGFAWVIWPDRCGLSECQPIDHLQVICDRGTITQALQAIAPVPQLANPLERSFLNAAHSQVSTQIVEYDSDGDDADRPRPYYKPPRSGRR